MPSSFRLLQLLLKAHNRGGRVVGPVTAFRMSASEQKLSARFGLRSLVAVVESEQDWHFALVAVHAEIPSCVNFGPGHSHSNSIGLL
jgi:hypothetical protein